MDRGYLYVASGQQYVTEAIASLASLKRCDPRAHVTLVTDRPVETGSFDQVTVLQPRVGCDGSQTAGFAFKTTGIRHSPYKQTFFVDTDTYFCESCRELFDLLDHYELLLAHAPSDISLVNTNGQTIAAYYPYNTGVMVFNKSAQTERLLEDWESIYRRKSGLYSSDQTALMEALLAHNIKVYVLQPNYNFRLPFFVSVPGMNIKLLHGRAADYDKIATVVNESDSHRSWNPLKQQMSYPVPPPRYVLAVKAVKRVMHRLLNLGRGLGQFFRKPG